MSFLPITIIITLGASLLVAYTMNPVFAVSFMKRPEPEETKKIFRLPSKKAIIFTVAALVLIVLFYASGNKLPANLLVFGLVLYYLTKYVLHFPVDKFQCCVLPKFLSAYRKILAFSLKGKRPYLVIASIVALLFSTFVLMGIKTPRVVFFPSGDPNSLMVYIAMPEGTHIDVTNEICKQVESKVFDVLGRDNPDVESVVSNVAVNAGADMFERFAQDKLAKVTVTFVEYKYRTGPRTRTYLDKLRAEVKGIPGAQIRIDREAMGVPTGMPINIEVSGEDLDRLVSISENFIKFLEALNIRGIEKLKSSMEVNKPELVLEVDREKANQLGMSTAQIGMSLRTAIYGLEISQFKEGDDEFPIQLRLAKKYREDIGVLLSQEITVSSRQSNSPPHKIPLSAVARVTYETSYGGVQRIDNQRVITITSNVLSGYNANEIVGRIGQAMPKFPLPEGYSIQFTGEQDMQAETGRFMVQAMFIALGLIFVILVVQFNSMAKPLIIISQFFFSFIGVLLGFVVFGIDISVMMTLHRSSAGIRGVRDRHLRHDDRDGDHRGGGSGGQERHHHRRLHRQPRRLGHGQDGGRDRGGCHPSHPGDAHGHVHHPGPCAPGYRIEHQLRNPVHAARSSDLHGRGQPGVLEPAGHDHHLRPVLRHHPDSDSRAGHVHDLLRPPQGQDQDLRHRARTERVGT
jgi:multidrug efflux pump subunit AcrB